MQNKNHGKLLMNQVTTELEKAVKVQFDHLNIVTTAELTQEEQPFLHISKSDDSSFNYEITLTLNGPNLFCLVDESGGFRVEGHSSWCSPVIINGYNQDLINYINQIE